LDQFNLIFGDLSQQAICAMYLVPSHSATTNLTIVNALLDYYSLDLPSPSTFLQEFKLWKLMWSSINDKPSAVL